jgi:hypothetical protein
MRIADINPIFISENVNKHTDYEQTIRINGRKFLR